MHELSRPSSNDAVSVPEVDKYDASLWMLYRRIEEDGDAGAEYSQATIWWFTSTAFPLAAGALAPIANLFSVCSLVHPWRLGISDGSKVHDPRWVVVIKTISLVLAVSANIVLLLNFARRVPYQFAQPVTVVVWYLSCIFLFVPLGIVAGQFLDQSTEALSESWYYGLFSGIVHFGISSLLVCNMAGAYYFRAYPPTFSILSVPQRSLMLELMAFVLYLSLMAGLFSRLEGWQYIDAVYWGDYTVLTIGLGSDFPLVSTAGRMVVIPASAFGIFLVGMVISSVRSLVLERGREKVGKRTLGKLREEWGRVIERKMAINGREGRPFASALRRAPFGKVWHLFQTFPRLIGTRGRGRDKAGENEVDLDPTGLFSAGRYEPWMHDEFKLMRIIETKAEDIDHRTSFWVAFSAFLVVWIGGSFVFWSCEHPDQSWTYPISLYFSYTSISTIGYGDFYPQSSAGRPFFVLWSLIAVPTLTVFVASMGDTVVKKVRLGTFWLARRVILPEKQTIEEIERDERVGERKRRDRLRKRKPAGRPLDFRHGGEAPNREGRENGSEKTRIGPTEAEGVPMGSVGTPPEIVGSERGERQHGRRGDLASRLARELVLLAQDVGKVPERKYSWEEWIKWIELLGRPIPSNQPPRVTSTCEEPVPAVEALHLPLSHFQTSGASPDGEGVGRRPGKWRWTWLSDHGPLFNRGTETEWLLERLAIRLEEVLESAGYDLDQ